MLAAGLDGAGGATSGIAGEAAQRAGVSRNAGGFQAALDDADRQMAKAAAGASEGIAAKNADVKLNQQNQAAGELGKLYGTDTSGMLESAGQQQTTYTPRSTPVIAAGCKILWEYSTRSADLGKGLELWG